jgi:hypothetical protein
MRRVRKRTGEVRISPRLDAARWQTVSSKACPRFFLERAEPRHGFLRTAGYRLKEAVEGCAFAHGFCAAFPIKARKREIGEAISASAAWVRR